MKYAIRTTLAAAALAAAFFSGQSTARPAGAQEPNAAARIMYELEEADRARIAALEAQYQQLSSREKACGCTAKKGSK